MYFANLKLESQNLTSGQCIVYTVKGGDGLNDKFWDSSLKR
jgi:hypothetical protein